MIRPNQALGLLAGVAAAFAIAGLSTLPVPQPGSRDGVVRLTWRARPERIEVCEEQSAEALERVPRHMRQAVVCDGMNASYRLEVQRDGMIVLATVVRPGGWRHDRPLYVFQDLRVPAGDVRIAVTFTRIAAGSSAPAASDSRPPAGDAGAAARRREELTEAVPPALSYAETLRFAPGQVRLISYDPERQRLFEVVPEDATRVPAEPRR